MLEDNGRFLQPATRRAVKLTSQGLSIDGAEMIEIIGGRHTPKAYQKRHRYDDALSTDSRFRETLAKIARYLDEGRRAEAIFIATSTDWKKSNAYPENNLLKANFNEAEPRAHGRWTTGGEQSDTQASIEDAQYRGYFHDFVLEDLIKALSQRGSIAIKNVSVFGIDGTLAIPDGAALPFGSIKPYFIEMKTGFDPRFTSNQLDVYKLICLGGHAVSLDPRIRQLGLIPGVPLPPLDIMIVHTYGPGFPLTFHSFCTDFSE